MATSSRQQSAPSQTQIENHVVPPARQPVLHLRGVVREEDNNGREANQTGKERHIQWAESVIDNEGLGRKSSKVCCIYHAPKGIDESSDESSSDENSSDDSEDDGSARPIGGGKGKGKGKGRKHNHDHRHGGEFEKGKRSSSKRDMSPNAYEKMPKPKDGEGGGGSIGT
ncbi:MAG: Type 1 phosphatases regulator ypi1 [Claussenomyces sp. TS43310]|nr:MAG: Type 1 phosphatases regulator ypi1 [Claussenomyces sp. TS43310]